MAKLESEDRTIISLIFYWIVVIPVWVSSCTAKKEILILTLCTKTIAHVAFFHKNHVIRTIPQLSIIEKSTKNAIHKNPNGIYKKHREDLFSKYIANKQRLTNQWMNTSIKKLVKHDNLLPNWGFPLLLQLHTSFFIVLIIISKSFSKLWKISIKFTTTKMSIQLFFSTWCSTK